MRVETATAYEVCYDCYATEVNGELGDDTYTPDREPLGDIPPGATVTSGWLDSEYKSRGMTPPDWENGEDDSLGFSWSPCDGCGSHLGGERFPLTVWVGSNEPVTVDTVGLWWS